MIRRLASARFDAAVIFTVYSQNPLPAAVLCYLADIPLRVAHCRENPYQLLTDWVREREPEGGVRHEVERQLDLVAAVGWRADDRRMRLAVPDAAAAEVERRLQALGFGRRARWAVVHPGASAPSRRYPVERFAAAVRALAERHGWRFVLTGSVDEVPLLEQVRSAAPASIVSLGGELSLATLAALIARAPLLISNNTGPVHIAAAVGTPVVDLYALTNPQHTPWLVPSRVLFHDVPCAPCYRSVCPERHHMCLEGVAPERVVEAALDLTRGGRRRLERAAPAAPVLARPAGPGSAIAGGRAVIVDVLIPTYRRPIALAVTMTSLCAQTLKPFRVIVADQTDGGASIETAEVRAIARVLEARGCEVRLLENLPRRGIAQQRQFLLEQASSTYALCLDDDVILEPYVIELLVDVIHREGCGFVGSSVIGLSYVDDVRPEQQHVELWDGPVQPEVVLPGTPEWDRVKLHSAANLYHVQQRLRATPDRPLLYKVAWTSACVMYDTAKLRAVGGFSFWRRLPAEHCGEDVLAQLELMKVHGGCGVMPSGAYHQELPTTIPRRDIGAERVLGWGCAS